MRVGLDGKHQPGMPALEFVREQGLDGASFRSPENFTPALDEGALRAARAYADAHGLYFELGVGRVNPYVFDQNPEIERWGGGDYRLGFERAVRACVGVGCREVWCVTGTYTDRFQGKAPWSEQLRATEGFLRSLAPFLRDVGCRLNLETHEEVTIPELLRLIEAVGPDVVGLCLDPANILARAADPVVAGRRIAPYVHMVQAKDAIVYFVEDGLQRQVRPCGEGVVDWPALLSALGEHCPDLNLSIEDHKGLMAVPIFDPAWRAGHADLTAVEVAQVVRLAWRCERRIAAGDLVAPQEYEAIPFGEQKMTRLQSSVAHLRQVIAAAGLDAGHVVPL
jgi:sugar phosphate isomerase/epimerase